MKYNIEKDDSLKEIEEKGIEKLRSGQLLEAVELFREAIQKGSQNFKSRLLLTKILCDLDRSNKNS
ncbi:MAG: hypothetical protein QNJ31_02350 [Candidatus Caenarcaniphilales bacterium]|nr:hypothetical protein [Candidatus Caenarcaniphilales bacterium]